MSEALANDLIDDKDGNLTAIINSSGHNKGPVMEKMIEKYNCVKDRKNAQITNKSPGTIIIQ